MARNEGPKDSEIEPPFDNPRRRRWWLLTKALESAQLQDALKIALAADAFIVEGGAVGLSPERQPIGGSGDANSANAADRPREDEALDGFAPTAGKSRYRQ
jgi:hypothetical protein